MKEWKLTKEWAAGFFDGEGCVSVSRRKRGSFIEHFISVQVGQNDERPLVALREKYGGSQCFSKTPSGCYRWRIHGKEAEVFLTDILPYSLCKREQIRIVLEIRKLIGKPGSRMVRGVFEKKEALWHELQRVKGKE